uniref:Uncharacterized protein n=1 Tax=Clastoptera arizonana TaxID=38151 RepID=A0A1B6E690_9HEMI
MYILIVCFTSVLAEEPPTYFGQVDPMYEICQLGIINDRKVREVIKYLGENDIHQEWSYDKVEEEIVKTEEKLLRLVKEKLIALNMTNEKVYTKVEEAIKQIDYLFDDMEHAHLYFKQNKMPEVYQAIFEARIEMHETGMVDMEKDVYDQLRMKLDEMPALLQCRSGIDDEPPPGQ